MRVNKWHPSVSCTQTREVIDVDELLLWDILGLSDPKILHLFMLQRQEGRTLLFQCLLNLKENRIDTKHLQSMFYFCKSFEWGQI